jgi:hypothetical protein
VILTKFGVYLQKDCPKNLNTNIPYNFSSPLYNKALDIFAISRNISHYMMDDLNALCIHGKEDSNIYFTGDIVQQSVSLAPGILKAEHQVFSEDKHRYAASVRHLTNLLDKNCDRLERCNSNGKEFIKVLRTELKKFKKLQRTWLLTL